MNDEEQFIALMVQAQPRLYSFICMLVNDGETARDLVQQTLLMVWKKRANFQSGTNFDAWAMQFARYEVLSFARSNKRKKLTFSTEIVELLSEQAELRSTVADQRRDALRRCLKRLSEPHRKLVEARYTHGQQLKEVATRFGRSADSVATTMQRIRQALSRCINSQMAEHRS